MGQFQDKVVFITGAARGQGRAHAVAFANEGADIIAIDICEQLASVSYPLATEEDLAETVRLVEETGRRIFARKADVRDLAGLSAAVEEGVAELGRLDVVIANAGISLMAPATEITSEQWRDTVDICETGIWHAAKAAIPHIRQHGEGGSMLVTASVAGIRPYRQMLHYVAAKYGAVGIGRALAAELGPENIRVNVICPTSVATPMVFNDDLYRAFRPDLEHPTADDIVEPSKAGHILDIPWVEVEDITNAALFLCSDKARYITGIVMPIDAGADLVTPM